MRNVNNNFTLRRWWQCWTVANITHNLVDIGLQQSRISSLAVFFPIVSDIFRRCGLRQCHLNILKRPISIVNEMKMLKTWEKAIKQIRFCWVENRWHLTHKTEFDDRHWLMSAGYSFRSIADADRCIERIIYGLVLSSRRIYPEFLLGAIESLAWKQLQRSLTKK